MLKFAGADLQREWKSWANVVKLQELNEHQRCPWSKQSPDASLAREIISSTEKRSVLKMLKPPSAAGACSTSTLNRYPSAVARQAPGVERGTSFRDVDIDRDRDVEVNIAKTKLEPEIVVAANDRLLTVGCRLHAIVLAILSVATV